MKYLLDTNTVIYFFKGMGGVPRRLLTEPPRDIAISTITVYELEVGLAKSTSPRKRRRQLTRFLEVSRVVPFGTAEAREAAEIRAALERRGHPIGPLDNLLAGTAKARGSILVTHNVQEFKRVRGLRVEDWYV